MGTLPASLLDAPPLVGTEIAIYIDGVATEQTDGVTDYASLFMYKSQSNVHQ